MMKTIRIAETTLCRHAAALSFKEKIEIARLCERLKVDTVELPAADGTKADLLLLRTLASVVKQAEISVAIGTDVSVIPAVAEALSAAAYPALRVELPVSPVGMEYTCHLKPQKMLAALPKIVSAAAESFKTVEFCALDATRAEPEFLKEAIQIALDAGANRVTLCDDAAELLPDAFAAFAEEIHAAVGADVPFGVACGNRNGMAIANAVLAARGNVDTVKTAVLGDTVETETLLNFIKNHATEYTCDARLTELSRAVRQMEQICGKTGNEGKITVDESTVRLDREDAREAVESAVRTLGYDLSDEDMNKVYEEFKRIAEKKTVGARELDAIVATTALQVPQTYSLVNYVVNSGNIIPASAQVRLSADGVERDGIQIGDGPIDAAFRAIEQIIGEHYELEDFRIQTVTEGREAMGSAIVKLRFAGKIYSGNGISTDIIGASIRAYLGAVNKIVYEEA